MAPRSLTDYSQLLMQVGSASKRTPRAMAIESSTSSLQLSSLESETPVKKSLKRSFMENLSLELSASIQASRKKVSPIPESGKQPKETARVCQMGPAANARKDRNQPYTPNPESIGTRGETEYVTVQDKEVIPIRLSDKNPEQM